MRRGARGSHRRTFLAARASVLPIAATSADAAGAVLRPAKLGDKRLPAQRSAHQLRCFGVSDESAAFGLVCREHGR
jgi:hypothetical protein